MPRLSVTVCLSLVGLLCIAPRSTAAGSYAVGAGDTIEVHVGGEADLSGDYKVSDEGTIVFPLLGAVPVTGKPVSDIAEAIRARLAQDYLVSPQVAAYVSVYGSKKIAVLGDVPTPGFYVLRADSSVLSLLSEAGLRLADGDATIIITRNGGRADGGDEDVPPPVVVKLEKLLSPWLEENPVSLSGGERVFVRAGARGKVIVSGKVKRPGVIALSEGMTVMEAINKAGGLAEFASANRVRVVRESAAGSAVMDIDVSAIMNGERSKDVALQDGDIIVVPRRWF